LTFHRRSVLASANRNIEWAPAPQPTPGGGAAPDAGASAESEAYGALVALGYRPAEAARLLKAVAPGTHSTEELIRRALQGAARE